MNRDRVVVVGGGVAAHHCVTTLRTGGFNGQITLVSEEQLGPYDRTLLSKEFLAGVVTSDQLLLQSDGYQSAGIDLLLGRRAVQVNGAAHHIQLQGQGGRASLGYDWLVVATGARARRPGPFATENPRVHVLRDVRDAIALRERLADTRRLIVVGAGFIGCEVASTAAAAGCEVVIVDRDPMPLFSLAGPEVGARLAELHQREGISLHAGLVVDLTEVTGGVRLTLDSGATLYGDAVVVGVGMAENSEWCLNLGGLEVDAVCRTATPDVLAAGDCTRRWSRREQAWLANGHWQTAAEHGSAAATTILAELGLAELTPFDPIPYFWSHQHGHLIQWLGQVPQGLTVDQLDLQIDDAAGDNRFIARYRHDGHLVAALICGQPRALPAIRREITHQDQKTETRA